MARWFSVWLFVAVGCSPGIARGGNPGEDDRHWFKLVTPNFHLYSNARTSEASRLLRDLETFRHVVSRFLGLTNVQRAPALVYLFENDRAFMPYKPRYDGKPGGVGGFHSADPMDTVLALSRQARGGDSTMRVLFHEYTHLLTARQFQNVPVWAHEGVAEVFSTFESRGDQFDIGVAVTNHVRYLQRSPPLPIASLLGVTRESPDYNEQDRAGKFYATSWLVAHHLVFARRGFETNVMAGYAAFCSATTNQFEAFRLAFGSSPEALDERLREYLKGGDYTIVRQTYRDLADANPREARLVPGELDFAFGRLLQMTQQDDAARERLETAAGSMVRDPRPRAALALLAWRHQDRERVRTLAAEALELGSQDAFLHFLAAEVQYQDVIGGAVDAADREEALAQGRRLCEQAVKIDPWLAPAHHLLGVYVLAANPRSPALAMPHVQRALRCDPQYRPAHLTWASLLAAQGNLGAARQVLARLLAGPLPADLRENAMRLAEQVDRLAGLPRPPSKSR